MFNRRYRPLVGFGLESQKDKTFQSLSQYHPYRFQYSRTYTRKLLTAYQVVPLGIPGHRVFNLLEERFPELRKDIEKIYVRHLKQAAGTSWASHAKELYRAQMTATSNEKLRFLAELSGAIARHEFDLFHQVAELLKSGQNIYHFPPKLLKLFKYTEVNDILLKEIKLPVPSLYLHFGFQPEIPVLGRVTQFHNLDEGKKRDTPRYFLEGAYVCSINNGRSITIVLTSAELEDLNRDKINFLEYPDEHIHTVLAISSPETTVTEALEADISEIRQFQYSWSALRGVGSESEISEGMEALCKAKEGALRLVINALLFICDSPEKIEEKYPPSAPAELVQAADSASAKAAGKAQERLGQLGHVKIKFCH